MLRSLRMLMARGAGAVAVVALVTLGGCGRSADEIPAPPPPPPPSEPQSSAPAPEPHEPGPATAEVVLHDRRGQKTATAQLREQSNGVMVTIEVVGLRRGTRGFHFHASGRCEPPEFGSAGPHFNPAKRQHGFDNPRGPHLGDLPNLIVQGEGSTVQSLFARGATLAPGPQSVRGRALVIHAERDDYRSDPSGDSGDRIACGVVPGV